MEVTNANFASVLPEFLALLETCEFYTMDQEMTGIETPEAPKVPFTAPLEERYPAAREAAMRYMAFQVGICLFHRTHDDTYDVRPFNFWLRSRGPRSPEVTLSMSAIEFLAANSMDFSKWLCEGLGFVDDATAAKVPRRTHGELLPASEAAWVQSTFSDVSAWSGMKKPKKDADAAASRAYDCFTFPRARPSIPAGFALAKKLHSAGLHCSVRHRYAERCKQKEAQARMQEMCLTAELAEEETLGFRKVWEGLTNGPGRGKLMVGHNFSSDLMFFLALHHGPLPASYEEFKADVHRLFPRVADTKTYTSLLQEHTGSGSTSLGPLFSRVEKKSSATCRLPIGFESYEQRCRSKAPKNNAVAHQGAFDAYMTGIVHLYYRGCDAAAVGALENKISVFGSCHLMHLAGADEQVTTKEMEERASAWDPFHGPDEEVEMP